MTSDFVRTTLSVVWRALGKHGYERALMGGVALASWNHPRATRDIDLLISATRGDVESLVSQLAESGIRPKRHPPLNTVGDLAFVHMLFSPPDVFYDVQLDLMLAESELQRLSLSRRVTRIVPGIDGAIDILSCEDLLLFKLISGRLIDLADAAMLLRENLDLDRSYLSEWLGRLGLTAEAQKVWHEAFPGDPFPF